MIDGDLVKLKKRYPIWLYSYGLSDGDLGIISKMEGEDILVYWLRIRRLGYVEKHLLKVVE
jgi:hypothetical protein